MSDDQIAELRKVLADLRTEVAVLSANFKNLEDTVHEAKIEKKWWAAAIASPIISFVVIYALNGGFNNVGQ